MNRCAVCLDESVDKDQRLLLPCWHNFCSECISRLVLVDESNIACPCCRSKVSRLKLPLLPRPVDCTICGDSVINPVTTPCCSKHLFCSKCVKKNRYESGIRCPGSCMDRIFNVDNLPQARICTTCFVIHSESVARCGHFLCRICRTCDICSPIVTFPNPIRGHLRSSRLRISFVRRPAGEHDSPVQSTNGSDRHRFSEGQDRGNNYSTDSEDGMRRDRNSARVPIREVIFSLSDSDRSQVQMIQIVREMFTGIVDARGIEYVRWSERRGDQQQRDIFCVWDPADIPSSDVADRIENAYPDFGSLFREYLRSSSPPR